MKTRVEKMHKNTNGYPVTRRERDNGNTNFFYESNK